MGMVVEMGEGGDGMEVMRNVEGDAINECGGHDCRNEDNKLKREIER